MQPSGCFAQLVVQLPPEEACGGGRQGAAADEACLYVQSLLFVLVCYCCCACIVLGLVPKLTHKNHMAARENGNIQTELFMGV